MKLDDRFSNFPYSIDDSGPAFVCTTCGALVPENKQADHNEWHETTETEDRRL